MFVDTRMEFLNAIRRTSDTNSNWESDKLRIRVTYTYTAYTTNRRWGGGRRVLIQNELSATIAIFVEIRLKKFIDIIFRLNDLTETNGMLKKMKWVFGP